MKHYGGELYQHLERTKIHIMKKNDINMVASDPKNDILKLEIYDTYVPSQIILNTIGNHYYCQPTCIHFMTSECIPNHDGIGLQII